MLHTSEVSLPTDVKNRELAARLLIQTLVDVQAQPLPTDVKNRELAARVLIQTLVDVQAQPPPSYPHS